MKSSTPERKTKSSRVDSGYSSGITSTDYISKNHSKIRNSSDNLGNNSRIRNSSDKLANNNVANIAIITQHVMSEGELLAWQKKLQEREEKLKAKEDAFSEVSQKKLSNRSLVTLVVIFKNC